MTRRARRLRKDTKISIQCYEENPPERTHNSRPSNVFWSIVCCLLPVLSFIRTLWFGFVYDDHSQIIGNPQIQSWGYFFRLLLTELWSQKGNEQLGYYYRPFFSLWLLLVHTLGGLAPWFWHLSSIFLHVLMSLGVFQFSLYLLKNLEAAVFTGLLFAVHAIHIESVCWASASNELLYSLFFLGSIFVFVQFLNSGPQATAKRWLSVLLWSAALFTKETAVALTFIFPLWAFLQAENIIPLKTRIIGALRTCVPFFLTVVAYLVIRVSVLRRVGTEIGPHTWREVLFTGIDLFRFYMLKLFVPLHLAPFYSNPVLSGQTLSIWATIFLTIAGIAVVCWIAIKREPLVGLAVTLILFPLVPVFVGIRIFRDGDLAHDRYLYLPSVGACLLLGLGFKYCCDHSNSLRRLAECLGIAIVIVMGLLNVSQQSYYRDDEAFYERGLEVGPTNTLVMDFLGDYYLGQGKNELALEQFRRASKISPDNSEVGYHLAHGLFETKNYAEAEPYLRRLSQDPSVSQSRRNLLALSLGQADLRLGKLFSAQTTLEALSVSNDGLRGVHQALGALYEMQGRYSEAQREYEREFQVSGDLKSQRRALVLQRIASPATDSH